MLEQVTEGEWRDPLPRASPGTFWGALEAADRRMLAQSGRFRSFGPATVICHQGRPAAGVYVLHTGLVEVYRADADGDRTVLARRGPGELFGDIAAVDGGPVSATVQVLRQSRALVIPVSRFTALCQERPRITWLVLKNALARLRDSDLHRHQHRLDIRRRTASCLLRLASAEATGGEVLLTLTQRELAELVPASLVSVTRVLEEFRGRGILSTGRGRITVRLSGLRTVLDS